MTVLSVSGKAALASLTLAASFTLATEAQAGDRKVMSATTVCAPYTSSAPDYATLRFRTEGIINDAAASKFVICNLPRDAEDTWVPGEFVAAAVYRRTTSGTPAITSNQCVWTVGNNYSEPQQSVTIPVVPISSTYGYSVLEDPPSGDVNSYGVAVCRISPGSLLEFFIIQEESPTDIPPAP